MSGVDIYKTAKGWRITVFFGGRWVKWPRYYTTHSGAAQAYRNTARAHRTSEKQETGTGGTK